MSNPVRLIVYIKHRPGAAHGSRVDSGNLDLSTRIEAMLAHESPAVVVLKTFIDAHNEIES